MILASMRCVHCEGWFQGSTARRVCDDCRSAYVRGAHQAVHASVARGEMPPAKELKCVDCDKPAHSYDHRDYDKPLEVEPVCAGCNRKRGHAIWNSRKPQKQAA